MKRLFTLFLVLLSTGTFAQDYDVTFCSLLDEMTDPAAHSKWNVPSYTCKQTSSYSRESVTPATAKEDGAFRPAEGRDWGKGWFENHDFGNFYAIDSVGGEPEFVMLDSKGPGVVACIWFAFMGYSDGKGGLVKVYVDGNTEPVISMDSKRMVGSNGLVGYPFSFLAPNKTDNDTWRGNNLILPIPYQNGCRISYKPYDVKISPRGTGLYYHIDYRSYTQSATVESFSKETMTKYAKDIYAYGQKLLGTRSIQKDEISRSKAQVIPAGKSASIKVSGEKCITSISIKLNTENVLKQTILKISFDDEKTVDLPVGNFFGIGPRQLANNTFYVQAMADGMMTAYWVMPFQKNANISLVNESGKDIQVDLFQITTKDSKWDTEKSMYFHASWCESLKLDASNKFDYNFVSIKGKGKFVGDGLTIYNYFPDSTGINWWGEGDEKIFVDGESFPSHIGTGTEDYYSYAYCRPQPFSSPNISQPIGDGNKTPGLTVNNRYRLLDDIPFEKSFDFYMEVWHPYYAKMDYAPATFWYAFKGCQADHTTK